MSLSFRSTSALLVVLTALYSHPLIAAGLQLHSGTEKKTLVELYTSQGCSSCPPAERWLGGLKNDPRLWQEIIPVAFHVDYWDYLGWKDSLASPTYSERQRRYHREGVLSTVYTPGFVVNGREWRRWFGLSSLPVNRQRTGNLSLRTDEGRIRVHYEPADKTHGVLRLTLAVLGVDLHYSITRGENAGKVLPQDFVVLSLRQHESHDGYWEAPMPPQPNSATGRLALVAWVSPDDQQAPLQAVGGWLQTERKVE